MNTRRAGARRFSRTWFCGFLAALAHAQAPAGEIAGSRLLRDRHRPVPSAGLPQHVDLGRNFNSQDLRVTKLFRFKEPAPGPATSSGLRSNTDRRIACPTNAEPTYSPEVGQAFSLPLSAASMLNRHNQQLTVFRYAIWRTEADMPIVQEGAVVAVRAGRPKRR
jgi:hypothetical protein